MRYMIKTESKEKSGLEKSEEQACTQYDGGVRGGGIKENKNKIKIKTFDHLKLTFKGLLKLCIPKDGSCLNTFLSWFELKGALDKYNIIPQLFPEKVGIFIPLEVLAWVMTACWVSRSRLTYFWSNMNISGIFYFSESTSINTQYSSL